MTEFTINVYDEKGNIVKTSTAVPVHFKFGTIRSLMELLNIDSIEDTTGLLKTIYSAWNELIMILNQSFPDLEYEDWDNIPLDELIPTVVGIVKYAFGEMMKIPVDSKNV